MSVKENHKISCVPKYILYKYQHAVLRREAKLIVRKQNCQFLEPNLTETNALPTLDQLCKGWTKIALYFLKNINFEPLQSFCILRREICAFVRQCLVWYQWWSYWHSLSDCVITPWLQPCGIAIILETHLWWNTID